MGDDLLKEIQADTEATVPVSDNDLHHVAQLASEQLNLLGLGIAKGPTGEAIQGLRDWAKKNKIEAPEPLKNFSIKAWAEKQNVNPAAILLEFNISELIGALVAQLARFKQLSEVELPAAMEALELEKFTLSNGYTVEIGKDTRASVRADKWAEALAFLKEHSLDGIVKNETKMNFDLDDTGIQLDNDLGQLLLRLCFKHGILDEQAYLGDDAPDPVVTRADAILAIAKEEGIVAEEKMSINAQTLKATVNAELAKGVSFPEECFCIQHFKKALVLPAKEPKSRKK